MNSGEPGSPRRRGPPRHAYQYVRPLAVTFAMPLRSTLTMTRLELLQFSVEIIINGFAGFANYDAGFFPFKIDARNRQAKPLKGATGALNYTLFGVHLTSWHPITRAFDFV